MLGSEHWEKNFKDLLFLVKESIADVWEVRKLILYGDGACSSHLQSQSSVGDLGGVTGVDGQRSGKLDKLGKSVNVSCIHFGANSHVCVLVCMAGGCEVDGGSATTAIIIIIRFRACFHVCASDERTRSVWDPGFWPFTFSRWISIVPPDSVFHDCQHQLLMQHKSF